MHNSSFTNWIVHVSPTQCKTEYNPLTVSVFFLFYRRKITFSQFEDALKLIAEKKYPGDADGLSKLEEKIVAGKGPTTQGATVCVINKH